MHLQLYWNQNVIVGYLLDGDTRSTQPGLFIMLLDCSEPLGCLKSNTNNSVGEMKG